jgi:hypothetical protein
MVKSFAWVNGEMPEDFDFLASVLGLLPRYSASLGDMCYLRRQNSIRHITDNILLSQYEPEQKNKGRLPKEVLCDITGICTGIIYKLSMRMSVSPGFLAVKPKTQRATPQ